MPSPSQPPGEDPEFHIRAGDESARPSPGLTPGSDKELELQQLFTELFVELHQSAARSMARAGPSHTLQATALIGEAYVRLQKTTDNQWESKNHFLLTAAKVMRSVLVDYHRRKRADKRDHTRDHCDMGELAQEYEERGIDLDQLEHALERLEVEQPIMAQAVQLRFFAGLEVAEIATILKMSQRTLERRMHTIRAWLRSQFIT